MVSEYRTDYMSGMISKHRTGVLLGMISATQGYNICQEWLLNIGQESVSGMISKIAPHGCNIYTFIAS